MSTKNLLYMQGAGIYYVQIKMLSLYFSNCQNMVKKKKSTSLVVYIKVSEKTVISITETQPLYM